ncbi:MAG: FtsQ-type POTRA domain-containing protein [Paenibacillaceae bacterium]
MANGRIPRLPKPQIKKNRGRKVIYLLLLFFIVLLIVLFFRSSISKIDSIEIKGNHYIEREQAGQALSIDIGDSFFSASAGRLEKRIQKLTNVESVTVIKHFPGQVQVKIKEFGEVAYVIGQDGKMRIVLSNGNVVIPLKGKSIGLMPVLSGWEQQLDDQKKLSGRLKDIPQTLLADISQIKPDPTASYPDRIRLYTRSHFEVITTIGYLPDKIDYMRAIISKREPGEIILLEANSYRSYESILKPVDESVQTDPVQTDSDKSQ